MKEILIILGIFILYTCIGIVFSKILDIAVQKSGNCDGSVITLFGSVLWPFTIIFIILSVLFKAIYWLFHSSFKNVKLSSIGSAIGEWIASLYAPVTTDTSDRDEIINMIWSDIRLLSPHGYGEFSDYDGFHMFNPGKNLMPSDLEFLEPLTRIVAVGDKYDRGEPGQVFMTNTIEQKLDLVDVSDKDLYRIYHMVEGALYNK